VKKQSPRSVDIDEVLPPGAKTPPEEADDALVQLVAHVMDNLFKLPGSKFRFGLDPLLGLLPFYGDTIANLISTVLLSQSARFGVPKIVMARMALNVLINALVGAIPFVGDAFSFWFKSNARNYDLLKRHARGERESTKGDWAFVCVLIAILAALVLAIIAAITFLVASVVQAVSSGRL
jgi:hypothetical protein